MTDYEGGTRLPVHSHGNPLHANKLAALMPRFRLPSMRSVAVVVAAVTILLIIVISRESMSSPAVNSGRTVTFHFTNWCGYCNMMKPVWAKVRTSITESTPAVKFIEVDEDKTPTPGITAYPTIIMIDEYGRASKYPGAADPQRLRDWILAPKKSNIIAAE